MINNKLLAILGFVTLKYGLLAYMWEGDGSEIKEARGLTSVTLRL